MKNYAQMIREIAYKGYDAERNLDYEGDTYMTKLQGRELDEKIRQMRKSAELFVVLWLIGQFKKQGYCVWQDEPVYLEESEICRLEKEDTKEIADQYIKKMVQLRIFQDENGKTKNENVSYGISGYDGSHWCGNLTDSANRRYVSYRASDQHYLFCIYGSLVFSALCLHDWCDSHDVYGNPATCTDRCGIWRISFRSVLQTFQRQDHLCGIW